MPFHWGLAEKENWERPCRWAIIILILAFKLSTYCDFCWILTPRDASALKLSTNTQSSRSCFIRLLIKATCSGKRYFTEWWQVKNLNWKQLCKQFLDMLNQVESHRLVVNFVNSLNTVYIFYFWKGTHLAGKPPGIYRTPWSPWKASPLCTFQIMTIFFWLLLYDLKESGSALPSQHPKLLFISL